MRPQVIHCFLKGGCLFFASAFNPRTFFVFSGYLQMHAHVTRSIMECSANTKMIAMKTLIALMEESKMTLIGIALLVFLVYPILT